MKTYRVEMRDTETKKSKYVDIFETDSESACATVRACANPFIEVVEAYELKVFQFVYNDILTGKTECIHITGKDEAGAVKQWEEQTKYNDFDLIFHSEVPPENAEPDEYTVDDLGPNWW